MGREAALSFSVAGIQTGVHLENKGRRPKSPFITGNARAPGVPCPEVEGKRPVEVEGRIGSDQSVSSIPRS